MMIVLMSCFVDCVYVVQCMPVVHCDWFAVVSVDVPGTATVIGPRTVVIGDNVTLNCSVTDPGRFFCIFDISLSLSLFLWVNYSSVQMPLCFLNDCIKYLTEFNLLIHSKTQSNQTSVCIFWQYLLTFQYVLERQFVATAYISLLYFVCMGKCSYCVEKIRSNNVIIGCIIFFVAHCISCEVPVI